MTAQWTCPLLAIIPARAGSKRLVGKNTLPLCGRPLWQWTIEAFERAGIPNSQWVVSTDIPEIVTALQSAHPGRLHVRPPELALDSTTSEEVVNAVVKASPWNSDWLVLLQPTSPLRSPTLIQQAWKKLMEMPQDHDGVLGVAPVQRRADQLYVGVHGSAGRQLSGMHSLSASSWNPSQLYRTDGSVYLVRTSWFRIHQSLFPDRALLWVNDAIASTDIDTLDDWERAEAHIRSGRTWIAQP